LAQSADIIVTTSQHETWNWTCDARM